MKNFKLCNNMGIYNQIQTLYTDYIISENQLNILLNSTSSGNVETNRMNVVEKLDDIQCSLKALRDYLYNCSLIDDDGEEEIN